MKANCLIVGAGGLAREVYITMRDEMINIAGFLGLPDEVGQTLYGHPICGTDQDLAPWDDHAFVLGIGNPILRGKIIERFKSVQAHWPNIISKKAHWGGAYSLIRIGAGNVIQPGVVATTDIHVGSWNHFNLNVTVGHDAVIGSCNVINPGVNISGGVTIGNACLIGTGAQILENLIIGDGVVIGAGAVVIKNVPPHTTVAGVPARIIKNGD